MTSAPRLQALVSAPSQSTEPAALQIRSLNFWYAKRQTLFDINLDISTASITALIGPSGCGKSTLLQTFNLMFKIYPDRRASGTVLFEGRNILDRKEDPIILRSRIGMVFQKPTPFPKTIFENIAFGIRLQRDLSKKVLSDCIEKALRQAALWDEVKDKLHKSAGALSGGQQQRLCIARTLATEPEVILLDEPCSALDPISTAKIDELIRELSTSHTIVIITHNLAQAARVAHNTVFLKDGKLIESGSSDQIFSNPLKKETEAYVTGKYG